MSFDSRMTQEGCSTIVYLSHSEDELANSGMLRGLGWTVVGKVHDWTGPMNTQALAAPIPMVASVLVALKGESSRRG